jgi:hypothetical protein
VPNPMWLWRAAATYRRWNPWPLPRGFASTWSSPGRCLQRPGELEGVACNTQGSCKQLPSKWLRAPAQPTPLQDAPPDREFLNKSKRSKVMVTTSTKLAEISPYGPTRATVEGTPLSAEELQKMDAYWRACCYLILGMLYLRENPLLRETLRVEHIKKRLLGHWGSSPGQSFVWTHLNRVIKKYDLNMIYVSGPGHGAPGVLAPVYLEGSYSEIYPDKSEDADGMRRFFRQFSFPGGIGSHCTPETPGSHPRGRRTRLQHISCVRDSV